MGVANLPQILNHIDSLLSWWERLVPSSWNKWAVGVISTYLFGYWALLTEQPPVIVTTVALVASASIVCLFTQVPILLRKYLSPPLTVIARDANFSWKGTRISLFILNTSPTHVRLELMLHIPLSNGEELKVSHLYFPDDPSTSYKKALGPYESIEDRIFCTFGPPQDKSSLLYDRAYLRITDLASFRSLKVNIPGKFPSEAASNPKYTSPL